MCRTLFILTILISVMVGGCRHSDRNVSPRILTLDTLLNQSDRFLAERNHEIAEIKHKMKKAETDRERFNYYDLLFDNYYTLSVDSALVYADKSIATAREAGMKEEEIHAIIDKASLMAATGLLNQASTLLHSIDPSTLSKAQLVDYYGQMVYLYSHLGNYWGGPENEYYVVERLYKDSVLQVIDASHPEYLWYKGWDILGTSQNPDTVIAELEKALNESKQDSRNDAKNAYILARLYHEQGNEENYRDYMALAAIIDVKIANSEISSLEDLSTLMFDDGKGDVDRAYTYINYSLNKALDYPNRSKAFGISRNLDKISRAYQERIDRQRRHTILFLVLVCVLAGILFIAVMAIVVQNKKVVRQRKEVDKANEELNEKVAKLSEADRKLNEMNLMLQELNQDLKEKNAELNEANFVKEEYIGYVFNLCSSYIAKIENLKRNIYLKAVKKHVKEIEAETADLDMKEEVKEFYHSFDTIFLTIYPNFVSEFNALLSPDKQIVLKEGEMLNMELRIYALVRLGITDSVKIADFLHCAPQTVYNYRLRARARSLYPKNEFIERIKKLGSFGA